MKVRISRQEVGGEEGELNGYEVISEDVTKRSSRSSVYGSNGMCKKCNIVVRARIILSLKKRFRQIGIEVGRGPIMTYLARLQSL